MNILIEPILTEKSARLAETEQHYAFKVMKEANKIQIRAAIEERYPDVTVKEVRTMIVRGKRRRQMTKKGVVEGRVAGYKKAIVTLRSGEIDLYEAV
ncbi:50S ribosomal protein L23 [Rubricoccus marinus]|uniref:Large ribosomal subunit protein uL23 n=1 Tax=Rubricoccus marinus TaxID=716817 RepID=A0A259U1N0_9BACT|nr:50S ribosomal protein L23 [Rubricoccus marinus]OZC03724.1 50S ribosomal protein L23 [Rubricoccus marinus]